MGWCKYGPCRYMGLLLTLSLNSDCILYLRMLSVAFPFFYPYLLRSRSFTTVKVQDRVESENLRFWGWH